MHLLAEANGKAPVSSFPSPHVVACSSTCCAARRRPEVVVALKEAPDEGLRVSLRSLGGIDVGEVAAALGGGGHSFMAGFTSDGSIDATLEAVRAAIAERLGGRAGRATTG
jgi:bifunctional oligoribonuclease and PAP phosphatase NrnA